MGCKQIIWQCINEIVQIQCNSPKCKIVLNCHKSILTNPASAALSSVQSDLFLVWASCYRPFFASTQKRGDKSMSFHHESMFLWFCPCWLRSDFDNRKRDSPKMCYLGVVFSLMKRYCDCWLEHWQSTYLQFPWPEFLIALAIFFKIQLGLWIHVKTRTWSESVGLETITVTLSLFLDFI